MHRLSKLLLLAGGICFLPPYWASASMPKKSPPQNTPAVQTAYPLLPPGSKVTDVETGSEVVPGENGLTGRGTGPFISQAASPYVMMHMGAREGDNNGSWKRHAVNRPGGNVHVLYGIFENIAGQNNVHRYNCYNPLTGLMSFADGAEPGATVPLDQNGALAVRPNGRAVWVGRGAVSAPGANNGTVVSFDGGACLGLITSDSAASGPGLPLDPDVYVVDDTSWVVFLGMFNGADIACVRTYDAGETFTPIQSVIISSFLNSAVAGNGNTIWIASTGISNDSANDTRGADHILYSRSTDGGVTWIQPALDASGPYELPQGYSPLFNGSLSAMMVGDTFHVAWLDFDASLLLGTPPQVFPGGHVHHLAIRPDLTVNGPHKAADIPLIMRTDRGSSNAGGFGFVFGVHQHPTLAYRPSGFGPSPVMYILWSAPPSSLLDTLSNYADTTVAMAGGRIYPNADIFCVASRNNGRSWDLPQNVTQTNHPGCDFNTVKCESEFYISAASRADSLIYVVAQMQTFPGFQVNGDRIPAPATSITTRLADEWRLYKLTARNPVIVASCISFTDSALGNFHLVPGGPPKTIQYTIVNTGLADLVLDSVRITGTLNGSGFITTTNAVNGTPIPEQASYQFTVTFNPANVQSNQSGLRSGSVIAYTHTNDPASININAQCQVSANVYVVPQLCLNAVDSIHSSTNTSNIYSQGAVADAGATLSGQNYGMYYPSLDQGYIFDGGVAIVDPTANPKGLRNFYEYGFVRCLTGFTKGFFVSSLDTNFYAKSLATGLLDSNIVFETLFEQSSNPNYSDFLAMTVTAVNITDSNIQDVILGAAFDIDVPTGFTATGFQHGGLSGPLNLSFDTSFTAASDGKTYTMLALSGIDTIAGEPLGSRPRLCTPNSQYFGAITISNDTAFVSLVTPRGAVIFNTHGFVPYEFDESKFLRRMNAIGYHTARNIGDSLTDMDTVFKLDSCPNGGSADIGFVIGAKKVTLLKNDLISNVASRYGLSSLAAGFDTLTLKGPSESFTILFVGGPSDLITFMEAADSAISWYNQNANRQIGGGLGPFFRGDLDGNRILSSSDVVHELNTVFMGRHILTPLCTGDLNFDGLFTSTDVVLELNYVFLGVKPAPVYPEMPELLTCFDRP